MRKTIARPAPTGPPARIPDANLRAALEVALRKSASEMITTVELVGPTAMDAADTGSANLTGLEHAMGLANLNLNDNRIVDLSPLRGPIRLAHLGLEGQPRHGHRAPGRSFQRSGTVRKIVDAARGN